MTALKQLLLAATLGIATIPTVASLPAFAGTTTFNLTQCWNKLPVVSSCTKDGITLTPSVFVPNRPTAGLTKNPSTGLGITKGWGEQIDSGKRPPGGYGSSISKADDEILILTFSKPVRLVGAVFTDSNNDIDAFKILMGDTPQSINHSSPMLVQDFITTKTASGYQVAVQPSDTITARNNGNGSGTFDFSSLLSSPRSVFGFTVADPFYDPIQLGWGQTSYRVLSVTVEAL